MKNIEKKEREMKESVNNMKNKEKRKYRIGKRNLLRRKTEEKNRKRIEEEKRN